MFGKIKKYVIGFFVLCGGVLFAFLSGKSSGQSKERRKDIDKKLNIVKKALKSNKKYKKDVQDSLKNKKTELEDLKKQKEKDFDKDEISGKEAADWLKKIK